MSRLTAVVSLPNAGALASEWERVELLCYCVARTRQGQALEPRQLERLGQLQASIQQARQPGEIWSAVAPNALTAMEYDLLACVMAPEVEPRVGWYYQDLQPGLGQPYPTPALVQELLALEPHAANELHRALAADAPLRTWRLIHRESEDFYRPIRPEAGVAARLMGRPGVEPPPPGTQRVVLTAGWEDLILPAERIAMLQEFLLWIRRREVVVERWGGVPVGGPVALFTGASGTGKTLAASVLASELGWRLYRVDLGRLVSKYIGETEQNLNALFDAAHRRPMILQFDEADSLFGRRGEVKEARDRYANMEVSHLLARIESHNGPCILTSNLRKHLDPAFARRFQLVVEFPRPDVAARTRLWARLLPPRAPRQPEVDPEFLGGAVALTGGHIRNAALHAAYLAAGEANPISLSHIALAVWRELGKDGREWSTTHLGPLAEYLPEIT